MSRRMFLNDKFNQRSDMQIAPKRGEKIFDILFKEKQPKIGRKLFVTSIFLVDYEQNFDRLSILDLFYIRRRYSRKRTSTTTVIIRRTIGKRKDAKNNF